MTDTEDIEELKREIAKLKKINAKLISRVERSYDQQPSAYALFETAIALDNQVRRRTQEVQQALRSIERANEDLRRAKEQAEAANLLKSSVLTSISHDLLQPLNAARLALSTLGSFEMGGDETGLIDQADRSLATLEELLRTLLDLSKLDAGVMTPDMRAFPIDDLVASLVKEQAQGAAKRGLKLRHFGAGRWVTSDPLLLRRVVQNLIANGLRYTRRGGVLVGGRARAGRWTVEVWDTGPGIPEERREAIFQEFQRGEAGEHGGQGFGLGLAIVRRLGLALEHPIDLSSRIGKGSMFSVSLPLAEPPKAQPAARPAEPSLAARGPLNNARVLVIENDAAVLSAMAALLRRWGCEVETAPSGDEAAEAARRQTPQAIIADLHLDHFERGALAVAKVRRAVGAPTPAMLVTADHSDTAAREAEEAQMTLLRKPVRPAELRSLLSYLLSQPRA
ncbi:ATP-binding protein [Roseiarcus sp.]|uniref:hybrid sensor histidine kinase/response regulator n=1 Tax=Roseiarcus sp. TaxID=1969460 RepID=UPI003F9D11CF